MLKNKSIIKASDTLPVIGCIIYVGTPPKIKESLPKKKKVLPLFLLKKKKLPFSCYYHDVCIILLLFFTMWTVFISCWLRDKKELD